MPARPLILGDNLLETTLLHRTHIVTIDRTEVTGHELWRAADNLRDLTWFTIAEANSSLTITLDCGSAQAADSLLVDRGHNLATWTCQVLSSDDGTTYTSRTSRTIPSAVGGLSGDPTGTLTPEGVCWIAFTSSAHRYWRIVFTNTPPKPTQIITGLYFGQSYRIPEYLEAGHAYDYRQKLVHLKNTVSQGGVRVKTRPVLYDLFGVNITSMLDSDFTAFQTEMNRLLRYGQPWWICFDDSTAAGCSLMRLFQLPGDLEYEPVLDPIHRRIQFEMESVIPVLYR